MRKDEFIVGGDSGIQFYNGKEYIDFLYIASYTEAVKKMIPMTQSSYLVVDESSGSVEVWEVGRDAPRQTFSHYANIIKTLIRNECNCA